VERSCEHADDNFRLTDDQQTRRVCWDCLVSELPELEAGQSVVVTRVAD
jgi:hypothetical protein